MSTDPTTPTTALQAAIDAIDWHDRADPTRCHAASQRSDGECWWRHCPARDWFCPLPQEHYDDE